MDPAELKELKAQLKDLLDKFFIQPRFPHGVLLFYLWKWVP